MSIIDGPSLGMASVPSNTTARFFPALCTVGRKPRRTGHAILFGLVSTHPFAHDLKHCLRLSLTERHHRSISRASTAADAPATVASDTRIRPPYSLLAPSSRERGSRYRPSRCSSSSARSRCCQPAPHRSRCLPQSNALGSVRTPSSSGSSARNCGTSRASPARPGWRAAPAPRFGKWRSPIGHDRIADIFVDDPLMMANWRRHRREVAVDHLDQPLRSHPLAGAGKSLDVAEQHVMTRRCPSAASAGRSISPSTMRGSTYFPKVSRIRSLRRNCSTI